MSTNLFKRARALVIFYQELDEQVNAHNHMSLCTLCNYFENCVAYSFWTIVTSFSHIYVAFVSFSLIYLNLISSFPLSLIFLGNRVLEELYTFNCILKKPEWPLQGMQRYVISYTYYFNLCSCQWGLNFGGLCPFPQPLQTTVCNNKQSYYWSVLFLSLKQRQKKGWDLLCYPAGLVTFSQRAACNFFSLPFCGQHFSLVEHFLYWSQMAKFYLSILQDVVQVSSLLSRFHCPHMKMNSPFWNSASTLSEVFWYTYHCFVTCVPNFPFSVVSYFGMIVVFHSSFSP